MRMYDGYEVELNKEEKKAFEKVAEIFKEITKNTDEEEIIIEGLGFTARDLQTMIWKMETLS